jgi:hypothetical protein
MAKTANQAGGYANRRAELWGNMKRALEAEAPFSLPDDNALQSDLLSCGYKFDSSGRLLLESKQDMKKRGQVSPDLADAVALTFAAGGAPVSAGYRPSLSFPRQRAGTGAACSINAFPEEKPRLPKEDGA